MNAGGKKRRAPRGARRPLAVDEEPTVTDAEVVTLARRQSVPVAMLAGLKQSLITEDIERLLAESAAPVVARTRTFEEWINGVDIHAQQLAQKREASDTAHALMKNHVEIVYSVLAIAEKANQVELAKLQTELAKLKIRDEMQERNALRELRLDTQRLLEQKRQEKLREPEPPPPLPERERVLHEHRQDRQARTRAGREHVEDFLQEVALVCESRASIHERALQLRNILSAFEMGDEELPADARWILEMSEKLRDAS